MTARFQKISRFLAFTFFLLLSVYLVSRSMNNLRWSGWAFGDAQMLNAGKSFARSGFIANHFAPLINPGLPHDLIPNNWPDGRYLHYPALHAVIIGVVASFFSDPLYPARIVMSGCTIGGLICFYFLLSELFNSWVALLFCIFYSGTTRYLEFADAMCNQSIDEFTRTAGLLVFWLLISKSFNQDRSLTQKQRLLLGLFWVIAFVNSLNSVEFIIFYQLLFLAFALIRRWPKRIFIRTFIVVLSAPVLGMFLHFIQGWVDHGSFHGLWMDWTGVMRDRTYGHLIKSNPLNPKVMYQQYSNLAGSVHRYFVPLYWHTFRSALYVFFGLAVLVATSLGRKILGEDAKSFKAVAQRLLGAFGKDKIAFLAAWTMASCGFYICFPVQSYLMDGYDAYQVEPLVALVFSLFAVGFFKFAISLFVRLKNHEVTYPPVAFLIALLLIPASLSMGKPLLAAVPYIKKYPNLLEGSRFGFYGETADTFKRRFATAAFIQEHTSPDDIVLTPQIWSVGRTYESNPMMEYYAFRHLIPYGDTKASLLSRLGTVEGFRGRYIDRSPAYKNFKVFVFVDDETETPKEIAQYSEETFKLVAIEKERPSAHLYESMPGNPLVIPSENPCKDRSPTECF